MLDEGAGGDHDRRIGLCREALALMSAEEAASPAAGWLEFVAGKALVNRAGPDRVADLTAAIGSFQAALATWTPEGQPANWAAAHVQPERCLLGPARPHRQPRGRAGSVPRPRRRAAADRPRAMIPSCGRELANNLGVLHLQRTSGDRAENLEEAISYLEAAAQLSEQHGLRAEWARTQANLGVAYRERVDGDRSENLERSLACLGAALESLGDDHDPVERARILLQRAETLRYRVAGTWAANVELAYADARLASELIAPEHGT